LLKPVEAPGGGAVTSGDFRLVPAAVNLSTVNVTASGGRLARATDRLLSETIQPHYLSLGHT